MSRVFEIISKKCFVLGKNSPRREDDVAQRGSAPDRSAGGGYRG